MKINLFGCLFFIICLATLYLIVMAGYKVTQINTDPEYIKDTVYVRDTVYINKSDTL